jgi:hypothetical protein
MSTAITMQELEFEHAELLPTRETLNCWCYGSRHSGTTVIQQDGNTAQYAQGGGFVSPAVNVSALNGNFDNIGGFL